MRKRIVCWGFILLACFLVEITLADDAEFRLVVSSNDAFVGGEFHVDLEMKITGGTAPRTLNSITADVAYTSQLTEYGGNPATGWTLSLSDGYDLSVSKLSGYYRIVITGNSVNKQDGYCPCSDPERPCPQGYEVTTNWQKIVT